MQKSCNNEQFEARQLEISKNLEKQKTELSEPRKQALAKTQDLMKFLGDNQIPAVLFINLKEGFHQFNSFRDVASSLKNLSDGETKMRKYHYDVMGAAISFFSFEGKALRVIVCHPETQEIILDTQPRKCDL